MGAVRLSVVLTLAVGWVACQPRDERPGLWLRGETVVERVGDWRFTNAIEEVFIETRPWYLVPHSTTIWCVELDGELYIGSYANHKKAWEKNIERSPEARLAIGGRIYEVTLTPATDRDRIAALDAAYARKYDMAETFGDEVPEWWYYHVAQRPHR